MVANQRMRKLLTVLLCVVLLLGLVTPAATAVEVEATSAFQTTPMIAAGRDHTVALRSDGTVWAWGNNCFGRLGDGTTTDRRTPVQVRNLNNVVAVAAGFYHTVALRSDGTGWAWGLNRFGELGDGTTAQRLTPVQVRNLDSVVAIAAGWYTVALRSDGTVWAWGWNGAGSLGDGTTTNRHIPVQVRNLDNVAAIAASNLHTIALRNDGTVWAWGSNSLGQLGDGTTIGRHTPVQVRNLNNVAAITAGNWHTAALRNDGTVWAWGYNEVGQLGDGTTTDRRTPVQVRNLSNVMAIAAGSGSTAALRTDGTVWLWGFIFDGDFFTTPGRLGGINDATALATGAEHIAVLRADGSVLTWGWNDRGQLGDGTTNHSFDRFVQVRGPGGVGLLNLGATERPSDWAVEQVNAAIAAGLVPQNLQSNYTAATTRAEFAALAVRLYENQRGEIRGRVTFADTNDVNVQKAAYIGVVLGVGNNRFAPNETLTREQAAVMLARLANAIGRPLPNTAPTFVDNHLIADWAFSAAGQVQAVGIMGGVGNNRFAPLDTYTREQSIVTIMRLFDFMR